jgi:hypothetical protein
MTFVERHPWFGHLPMRQANGSQLLNYKQTTISEAQKKAKTLFSFIGHISSEN